MTQLLDELKKELEEAQRVDINIFIAKDLIERVENVTNYIAAIVVLLPYVLILTLLLYFTKLDFASIFIILLYPGTIAAFIFFTLAIERISPTERVSPLVAFFSKTNQETYDEAVSRVKDHQNKILVIKRNIEDEEDRIFEEENKKKELYLIEKLNGLLNEILTGVINHTQANSIYAELKQIYDQLKVLHFHTGRYYTNRFYKIGEYLRKTNDINVDQINQANPLTASNDIVNSISDLQNAENIFSKERAKTSNRNSVSINKNTSKIDYVAKASLNKDIGMLGELFAFRFEANRVLKYYLRDKEVKHISLEDDSKGFDILSYDENGLPKYIEVKSTTDDVNSQFYITESEINAMKSLPNYFIYRVYDLNMENGEGSIYIVNGADVFNNYFELTPISYKVNPKIRE